MRWDWTSPLKAWNLPECFATIRRPTEARMGKKGMRECVQFLLRMEMALGENRLELTGGCYQACFRSAPSPCSGAVVA